MERHVLFYCDTETSAVKCVIFGRSVGLSTWPLGDAQWSCVLVLEHLVCKQSNISVHRKLSMTFLYRRTIGKLRLRLRSWYSKTPYNDIGFRHSDVIYGFLPRNFDHLSASRVGKTIASDGKDLAFWGQLLKFFSFLSFCAENRNNSDSPSARAPFPSFCPVDSRWLFYPNTWESLSQCIKPRWKLLDWKYRTR